VSRSPTETDRTCLKEFAPVKKLGPLMPIVVAVGLGPLVAGLIVSLLAVSTSLFHQTGELPIVDLLGLCGVYIIFAYVEGGIVALLAGLLVSMWMVWRPASLVVAVAAALASVGLLRLAAEIGMLGASGDLMRTNLGLMLVLAVTAAGVCWFLTRRFMGSVGA
jgi:hypothetical protein